MDELEKLFVTIDGNVAPLLKAAKEGVKLAETELKRFGDTGEKSFDQTGKGAKGFSLKMGALVGVVTAATTALINMAARGVAAIGNLASRAVGLQSEAEDLEIVFSNIFGDRESALAYMDHLRQKAADLKVPFSAAAQFAKSILPDAKSVEQFDEVLRLAAVGAKDARLPLQELVFSFNELASGDLTSIRDRLDLPKSVAENIKAAGAATGDYLTPAILELNKLFERRGINDIEQFSDTLSTTLANLSAFGERLLEIASRAGFETLKQAASDFLKILQDNRPQVERIAAAVGDIADQLLRAVTGGALEALQDVDFQEFVDLANNVSDIFDTLGLIADVTTDLSLGNLVEDTNIVLEKLQQALVTAGQIGLLGKAEAARLKAEDVKAKELGLGSGIAAYYDLGDMLTGGKKWAEIEAAGQEAFNQAVLDSLPVFDDYNKKQEERRKRQSETGRETQRDTKNLQLNTQALADNAGANEELLKQQADLGNELEDLQAKTEERLEELASDHNDRMTEIESEYVQDRLKLGEKLADDLEKLNEETAAEREQIIKDTAAELAKLESETDRDLADERQNFDQQELRETEDHLARMRQLRQNYISSLSEAVASRDARAIVDLRRQFQEAQAKEEEGFTTSQARRGEDQDQRLAEIRQNEQDAAAEIIAAREEDLAGLMESERVKREEIRNSFTEQMTVLDTNRAEALAKENQSYSERQAELETAMQERLESIATGLASNLEMEQATAEQVLKLLADTYGPEGSALAVLEAYAERRKKLLELAEAETPEVDTGATSSGPGGRTRRGPGLRSFAAGGSFLASNPTLIQVGEAGPELVNIRPIGEPGANSMMTQRTEGRFDVNVNFQGLPAGMDAGALEDVVAGIMVEALRESGLRR